jgi:hypothetical protein
MRSFLESGTLDSIRPGDPVEKLRDLWGEPTDQGGRRKGGRYNIWKYGDVEFHLNDDFQTILQIFCDSYQSLSLGEALALEPWLFKGHPSMDEVKEELTNAGLEFREEEPTLPDTNTTVLRLDSGVRLLIAVSVDDYTWPPFTGLYGFHYAC